MLIYGVIIASLLLTLNGPLHKVLLRKNPMPMKHYNLGNALRVRTMNGKRKKDFNIDQ